MRFMFCLESGLLAPLHSESQMNLKAQIIYRPKFFLNLNKYMLHKDKTDVALTW